VAQNKNVTFMSSPIPTHNISNGPNAVMGRNLNMFVIGEIKLSNVLELYNRSATGTLIAQDIVVAIVILINDFIIESVSILLAVNVIKSPAIVSTFGMNNGFISPKLLINE
jgi:hypothetical protein